MEPREMTEEEHLRSIDDSWMMDYGPPNLVLNTNSDAVVDDDYDAASEQSETLSAMFDRWDTLDGVPPFRRPLFSRTPTPELAVPGQPVPVINLTEIVAYEEAPRHLKRKAVSDTDETLDGKPDQTAERPKTKKATEDIRGKIAKRPSYKQPAKRGRQQKKARGRPNASNTQAVEDDIAAEGNQQNLAENDDATGDSDQSQESFSDESAPEEEPRASDGEYEEPRPRKKERRSAKTKVRGGTSTSNTTGAERSSSSSPTTSQQQSSTPAAERHSSTASIPRLPNGRFIKRSNGPASKRRRR